MKIDNEVNNKGKIEQSEQNLCNITGQFKYCQTVFWCCKREITLYMTYNNQSFILYKDPDKKKEFISIIKESIININQRHIHLEDRYDISIHYNNTKGELKELKLKCKGRSDIYHWIDTLRKAIQPKAYVFNYSKEKYEDAAILFPIKNTQQFYIEICNLEYILCRRDIQYFFELLKDGKKTPRVQDSRAGNDLLSEKDILIDVK